MLQSSGPGSDSVAKVYTRSFGEQAKITLQDLSRPSTPFDSRRRRESVASVRRYVTSSPSPCQSESDELTDNGSICHGAASVRDRSADLRRRRSAPPSSSEDLDYIEYSLNEIPVHVDRDATETLRTRDPRDNGSLGPERARRSPSVKGEDPSIRNTMGPESSDNVDPVSRAGEARAPSRRASSQTRSTAKTATLQAAFALAGLSSCGVAPSWELPESMKLDPEILESDHSTSDLPEGNVPGQVTIPSKGGYILLEQVDWNITFYREIQEQVRVLAAEHLDITKPFAKQTRGGVQRVCQLVRYIHPSRRRCY
ncbi:hypothetical protein AURDEDRAFT_131471 [Auricularia subglabra TFB-10046 SS5]|uniref:Uncharacterized protein n=1 Tax=Auricularia subglabra (strain TFB-10046 / SS5) TaxID=717982 RepID=J0LBM2_AURST|nr:hypothetical protein AURDEDRAFT_131471 [Auricularia subglabra TFB-10046 SS5]